MEDNMIDIFLTESAKETILTANTPSYMFHRLQTDVATLSLIESVKSSDLLGDLKERLSPPPNNPAELTTVYIELIALGIVCNKAEFDQLRQFEFSAVHWGKELFSLVNASRLDSYSASSESGLALQLNLEQVADEGWDEVEMATGTGGAK